eukprot:m.81292 g.81292  ORF g.81292 m.81292 type:complete len:416 (-) comp12802_c0_seq4:27-1274(-)
MAAVSFSLLVTFCSIFLPSATGNSVSHDWGQLKTMMWADYRSPTLLNDSEASFLATHYAVLSLEKCTGQSDGFHSEDGVYMTAKKLKAINPNLKVFFYWGVELQGYQCSRTLQALNKTHPEYFLKDDHGNFVTIDGYPQLDYRLQEARDFWTSQPFNIGPDAHLYIDGILADGAGPRDTHLANFSNSSIEALNNGSALLLHEMQAKFNATNGGMVLGNGINMYPNKYQGNGPNIADYNMGILKDADGIESEHVAAFESRDHKTGALNTTRLLINLGLIERGASMGKSVMMNEWAGPVTRPMGWPTNTPTTPEEWQAALTKYFNFSLALYLSVASETVFFEYIEWYPVNMGVVPCAECWAPPQWYPEVNYTIGKPLGPRKTNGNVLSRSFENVDITVDLLTEKATINWHSNYNKMI